MPEGSGPRPAVIVYVGAGGIAVGDGEQLVLGRRNPGSARDVTKGVDHALDLVDLRARLAAAAIC